MGKAREESAGDRELTQVELSDVEWTKEAHGAAGRTASSYEQRQCGVSKPEREKKREGARRLCKLDAKLGIGLRWQRSG